MTPIMRLIKDFLEQRDYEIKYFNHTGGERPEYILIFQTKKGS